MTDIVPKYFDHPDYCIRFLEWQALRLSSSKASIRNITITLMHIAEMGALA